MPPTVLQSSRLEDQQAYFALSLTKGCAVISEYPDVYNTPPNIKVLANAASLNDLTLNTKNAFT